MSLRIQALGIALLPLLGFALGTAAADETEGIVVTIDQPSFLKPSYGEVEIKVHVVAGEPVTRVEFFVDGRRVGQDTTEPYILKVDVGYDNREHHYEAVAYGASGAVGRNEVTTPDIRVDEQIDLELQQLYVTVTNSGQRVQGLPREAFEILDDGRREKLVTFEGGDAPLTAVLLIDASESMKGAKLEAATRGARVFVDGMKELDEGMVMMFSDQVVQASEFTGDKQVLVDTLEDVRPAGGTALNDHLYTAINFLDTRQGRRVVILMSDGIDVLSVLRMKDIVWRARRSQAMIYWIHLGQAGSEAGSIGSAWRDAKSNQRELDLLAKVVEESGGTSTFVASLDELDDAYAGVLQELREQYVLGYYPTDLRNDGRRRLVRVKVDRFGMDVRAREGYVDF